MTFGGSGLIRGRHLDAGGKKCLIGGVALSGSDLIREGLLYTENNNICWLLFDCVIISVFLHVLNYKPKYT